MNTLTIKIPPALEHDLQQASEQEHVSKSELVRRALTIYLGQRTAADSFISALDLAGELAGCFSGGPADLSSNPRHLDGFGRT
ncbi:ribbon-helix-helix protein, CopG family [Pseudothauera rhizosphaerae]|uniref:Ribbon-helix-helix protein, CopG family n=1 Tax=Pseudothauera rhizosphaerae TaxID=2565932 RepID=A0A4S4ANM5_9RHOO|nr:ribbon-helix-helix protein, CopG family [Pseudothauera rhizosphaerae]THF60814.1 ribbon-helix-helix protein, CopG family [Pseudothauera rhizosphaerae]